MTGDLIERLEKAEAGSRELDVLIGSVTGYRNRFTGQLLSEALADPDMHDEAMRWEGVPPYTSSVDGGLRLAEWLLPLFTVTLVRYRTNAGAFTPHAVANLMCPYGEITEYVGNAPTPALALCIAILKARTAASSSSPGTEGGK